MATIRIKRKLILESDSSDEDEDAVRDSDSDGTLSLTNLRRGPDFAAGTIAAAAAPPARPASSRGEREKSPEWLKQRRKILLQKLFSGGTTGSDGTTGVGAARCSPLVRPQPAPAASRRTDTQLMREQCATGAVGASTGSDGKVTLFSPMSQAVTARAENMPASSLLDGRPQSMGLGLQLLGQPQPTGGDPSISNLRGDCSAGRSGSGGVGGGGVKGNDYLFMDLQDGGGVRSDLSAANAAAAAAAVSADAAPPTRPISGSGRPAKALKIFIDLTDENESDVSQLRAPVAANRAEGGKGTAGVITGEHRGDKENMHTVSQLFCGINARVSIHDNANQRRLLPRSGAVVAAEVALAAGNAGRAAAPVANSDGVGDDDEAVLITGERGMDWQAMPHPRYLCLKFPFQKDEAGKNNVTTCENCWCFVCDIKAEECSKWNLGLDADNHCNACFESPKWCTLRAEHVKARAEEQAGRMKGNGDGGAPGPFPRLHPEPGLPGGDDNHSGLPGRGEHNGGPSRGDMVGSDVQGVDGRETLQQLMLRRLEAHRLVVLDAEVAWQQRYMSRTGAAAVGVISSGDGSKAPGGGGGGAVVGKVGGSSGDLDANAGGSGASLRLDDGVKIGSGRGGGGVGGARYGGDGGSGPKVHIVRHTIGIGGCKEMIMGRGGQTMGSLRKSTGARIKIQNDGVSVSIAGTQTQVDEAIKLVRAIITRGSRPTVCPMLGGGGGGSGGNGQRSNDFATRTMATGGAQNDEIIGAGGMTINILRQRTGANIQAIRSGTSVTITGTLMQVNQATSLVQAIISRGSGPTLYPPGAGAGGGVGVGYQQVFPPRGR